jgi:hypothetical protein
MQELLHQIADKFTLVLIALCFLVTVVLNAVVKIVTSAGRERSRREIAAYVAEGSITPEQGERLIRADVNRGPART